MWSRKSLRKSFPTRNCMWLDAFCGANKDTRMAIRFIMEVAWQAHFVTNMFIQPTAEELENFEPDFVVYNASKAKVPNYKELGLNSETAVVFNITSREQVIINTWYGGEMKKGIVLHDELLSASEGHRFHALLRQHGYERREYRHLLRTFRNRQDHPCPPIPSVC